MMSIRKMRKVLQENGYTLIKSRVRVANPDNLGGYQIIHNGYNAIVAGSRYELTAGEVLEFILDNIGNPF